MIKCFILILLFFQILSINLYFNASYHIIPNDNTYRNLLDIKNEIYESENEFILLTDNVIQSIFQIPTIVKFLHIKSELLIKKIIFKNQGKFELENTNILFSNIEISLENSLVNDEIIRMFNCYSNFQNLIIKNIIMMTQNLISIYNSTIIFQSIKFSNLIINQNIIYLRSFWDKNNIILFSDCQFKNISGNINEKTLSEIISINNFASITIKKSSFLQLKNIEYIINIMKIKKEVILNDLIFQNIMIKSQIINIEFVPNLSIFNLIFSDINYEFDNNLGGCLRSFNIIQRNFENIEITNGFSDVTTIGLKIIDNSINILNFKKQIEFNGKNKNFVNYCNFHNNLVSFIINSFETGVSIYLSTDFETTILNCTFKNNTMFSSPKKSFLASSPCILSNSIISNLSILFSNFIDNHSKFGSNCISFSGSICFFKGNRMINNTDVKASIKNLNMLEIGGAFHMTGLIILVSYSIFNGNSGNVGGSFFFQTSSLNSEFSYCYFKNNYAFFGGALYFSSIIMNLNSLFSNIYFEKNFATRGGAIFLISKSIVLLTNVLESIFLFNDAEVGGCFDINIYNFGILNFKQNIYYKNIATSENNIGSGSAIKFFSSLISSSSIKSSNCTYINNYSQVKGTLIIFSGIFQEFGSFFYNNSAFDGATIYTVQKTNASFQYCNFLFEHSGNGGGSIALKDLSLIYLNNVVFKNCYSFSRGGTINISERSGMTLISSTIINSNSNFGGIIYLQENYQKVTSIQNCTFINNQGYSNLIDSFNSELNISDSFFENNKNNLFVIGFSLLFLKNLTIKNQICNTSYQGCLLKGIDDSRIRIEYTIIENIESRLSSGNIIIESSEMNIYNSFFKEMKCYKNEGSCIFSYNSTCNITLSIFNNYDINCIVSYLNGIIIINNSEFKNNFKNNYKVLFEFGSIACIDCYSFYVKNCFFYNNSYLFDGGAIYLNNNQKNNSEFVVLSNFFFFNEAYGKGGNLFISKINIVIVKNIFLNNFAYYGGAIYSHNGDNSINNIKIENNIFIKNQAKLEGGAIKWENQNPILIISNNFINNSAKYGNNVAAYPIKFLIEYYVNINNEYILLYNTEQNLTSLIIKNLNSGNKFNGVLVIKLLDYYNETVTINEGYIQINSFDDNELISLIIEGITKKLIKSGKTVFDNLYFYYAPSENSNLILSSNLIKNYNYSFQISFRKCEFGEIYLEKYQKCQECKIGEYSFIDGMLAKKCKKCPQFAISCYKNIIILKSGYWRSNISSDLIYVCKNFEDKCLGGSNITCLIGYEGPLCSTCSKGYAMLGNKDCNKCGNKALNIFLIILGIMFLCLFLGIIIRESIIESDHVLSQVNKKKTSFFDDLALYHSKKGISIYQKILLNYIQMISIIHSMNLKWPLYLNNYMNIFSSIGSASSTFLSTDCFLYDYDIEIKSLYSKTIFIISFPLIIILISCVVFVTIFIITKKKQINRISVLIIIITVFFQPAIIQKLSDNFSCKKIDEIPYLTNSLITECFTDEYNRWILIVILPFFIIYVVVFPIVFLTYLCKSNRESIHLKANAGFFINGYKKEYYYWEFVILFRKMLFISVGLISGENLLTRGNLLLLISSISLYLTNMCKPFIRTEFNILELYSNLTTLMTIFAGNLYLSNISDYFRAFVFVFIVFISFSFTIRWIWSMTEILFYINFDFLFKFCPFISKKYYIVNHVISKTRFSWNFIDYFKRMNQKNREISKYLAKEDNSNSRIKFRNLF